MKTNEKNAVEAHVLKAFGFHPATPKYKLLERLFKDEELIFEEVGYDNAVSLRKELWLLQFECGMRFNKIIVNDEVYFNYYVNVMGLIPRPQESGNIIYDESSNYNLN